MSDRSLDQIKADARDGRDLSPEDERRLFQEESLAFAAKAGGSEDARALGSMAVMLAWNLETACRMARPLDDDLHKKLGAAWARATEVVVEQRQRWQRSRRSGKGAAV